MASDGLSDPFDDMSLGEGLVCASRPANIGANAKHTVVSGGASSLASALMCLRGPGA